MTSLVVIQDIDIIDHKLVDILYLYNNSIEIFKNLRKLNHEELYIKFNNIINKNISLDLYSKQLINNFINGDLYNKLITPIINDTKYYYGNSIIINNFKTFTTINYGTNKINNLDLEYDEQNKIYFDPKTKNYFYDFLYQLDNNSLFDYNLYTISNTSLFNNCINDKVNVIRNCNNNSSSSPSTCIEIIGNTYYKNKNIIDDNKHKKINYEERILLKNNLIILQDIN